MAAESDAILTDGSVDFGGGVNSVKPTTLQSPANPRGLKRNELAWLVNGSIRDGGISTRWGWQPVGKISDGSALYQGGWMYDWAGANPYLVLSLGGRIYQVTIDPSLTVTEMVNAGPYTGANPKYNPATVGRAFFQQISQFLVIQPGDYATLPNFWMGDGTFRRSKGITNTGLTTSTPGVNEIPAAGPMAAYMNRLWYAQDSWYGAGDISKGPSGTAPYGKRDAVLNVTENPLCVGGDGFEVDRGNIRALRPAASLNTALGQGQLYVFTRDQVNALTVPVTRNDWIGADGNNMPLQTVAQFDNGTAGERGVVNVNGDIYMMSEEPNIRSLVAAIRYFQQPGNVPISANESRILQFTNRAYMAWASGIQFDNRLLMTALPYKTPGGHIAFKAIIPLDFEPISSFGESGNPAWEGHYEGPFSGVDILQLFQGNFGGRRRAFAVVVSRTDGSIWLWEMMIGGKDGDGESRTSMRVEFPAYTWMREDKLKKLVGAHIWCDRIYGKVDFKLSYKVDGESCSVPWYQWSECSSRNCQEDLPPSCYPYPYPAAADPARGMAYDQTKAMPAPPARCSQMKRPSNIGHQFQPILEVTGYCRVRAIWLHANEWKRGLYEGLK